MRTWLPAILLLSYFVLGALLIADMVRPERKTATEYSILDLPNEQLETMMRDGSISQLASKPNSKLLIRVRSGGPTRIPGPLPTSGEIFLINPRGIMVGAGVDPPAVVPTLESTLESQVSPTREDPIALSTSETGSSRLIARGNVYALAQEKSGGENYPCPERISQPTHISPRSMIMWLNQAAQ